MKIHVNWVYCVVKWSFSRVHAFYTSTSRHFYDFQATFCFVLARNGALQQRHIRLSIHPFIHPNNRNQSVHFYEWISFLTACRTSVFHAFIKRWWFKIMGWGVLSTFPSSARDHQNLGNNKFSTLVVVVAKMIIIAWLQLVVWPFFSGRFNFSPYWNNKRILFSTVFSTFWPSLSKIVVEVLLPISSLILN